jgi:hypothetical protein
MHTWLQRLKNTYHWSNKIHVASAAHFLCEGTLLKTHIRVDGNNSVTIGHHTTLAKVELTVMGENNRIKIGNACHIENDTPAKAAAFMD